MTVRTLPLALAFFLFLAACGGNPPATDAGMDSGTDAAGPRIENVPLAEELALPGLDGAVEVVFDTRGMPHIYGTTRHDVIMAQGYLMAVDRFAQMEIIRRNVLGRLSEFAGNMTLTSDVEQRSLGFGRVGRTIYGGLPADDVTRLTAEAFVEGVNAYVDRVRRRELDPAVPGAEVINLVISSPFFGPWEAADIFALARFQAWSLSYDGDADARRSARFAAAVLAFPAASADPRLAARAGFVSDFYGEWPAREAFTRDGWNDGTTSAIAPLPGGPVRPSPVAFVPSRATVEGALPFFDRAIARGERVFGDLDTRGSNNWVVSGALTASGHPILSNDPHLSLISPPVWWYVHLDTARMGGAEPMSAEGVAFAGLPGVVLGFNRHVAWGATTTGYDVTDDYEEQLTGTCDAMNNVTGGTVRFQGADVPVAFYDETIHVAGEADPAGTLVRLPYVPHHGMLVPGSCAPVAGMPGRFTALSIRYTGDEPSNELAYFTALATAADVGAARTAQAAFRVGSQNFVSIDAQHIQWSTGSRIPVRDPRAMTFAIGTDGVPTGLCPHLVLPGTGEYEWTGDLDPHFVPHDLDPARGWIATANQDNVGATRDGNPCNDPHYVGAGFDFGWREGRIQERLGELATRGGITHDDMVQLQGESQSQLGRTLRDPIVAILAAPLDAVPGLSAADQARLADAHDRLAAWTLETPSGVGATDATEIADSVATAIFNAAVTRLVPATFADEVALVGYGRPNAEAGRLLEWMMASPSRLYTYDAASGESVLWDDLGTPAVETKGEIVVSAVLAGLDFLATTLGADPAQWRWGRLHTVRFQTVVPAIGADEISIPPPGDTTYPDGFPRHGDLGAVDASNFGLWGTTRFSFGSGPSQRLVVEMLPDGPLAWNALPGGQSIDVASPHHADEAMLWIRNEQPPLFYREEDVVAHAERRIRLHP